MRKSGIHTFNFNPLPPHGGRLGLKNLTIQANLFQSTPSAWRETVVKSSLYPTISISIHSLRMEGDRWKSLHRSQKSHFNPLPPHGGRLGATNTTSTSRTFQSTPSAWRETRLSRNFFRFFPFQSTPSAWRETQRLGKSPEPKIFQSTPSAWRETFCSALVKAFCGISIHSLRMEGDFLFFAEIVLHWEFQSTPSAWRETLTNKMISLSFGYFNPLPPHGGRHTR